MPEFKVTSGTLDAVIQFFEQTLHITFPTNASGGGGGGGGAAVQQPAPIPPQDIHQTNFTVFPADAGQAAFDAINELLRHSQEMRHQAGADGNAFGSFGPNMAQALIEAINDPHRPHDAFSDWFQAVGAPWTDIA